jgi:hypothetical protein
MNVLSISTRRDRNIKVPFRREEGEVVGEEVEEVLFTQCIAWVVLVEHIMAIFSDHQ